ncbi:MAG TPA: hypothetical protein VMR46_03065 [Candidatus Paceibacterota bacterium]|nr:hypothetical protein [Candidatus Paceibacterota bacterium]
MAISATEERLFASAMPVEHRAAQRLGQSLLVGIACKLQLPTRPVISFGFAGALCDTLPMAAAVVISTVVDENGHVLWRGKPLVVQNAHQVVVVSADHMVDSVEERAELRKRSGAQVVDMETSIYARLGLLVGGLRVISDTPTQRLASTRGSPRDESEAHRVLYSLKRF